MLRWAGLVAVALVLVVVAVQFGAKWVVAPLIGYAVYKVGTAMLRNMAQDARGGNVADEPTPVLHHADRTLYWCEHCGAELLLVVRGADAPPRHCGERMHQRVEITRN